VGALCHHRLVVSRASGGAPLFLPGDHIWGPRTARPSSKRRLWCPRESGAATQAVVIWKEEERRSTAARAGKFERFAEKGIPFLLVGLWLCGWWKAERRGEGSRLVSERRSRRRERGRGGARTWWLSTDDGGEGAAERRATRGRRRDEDFSGRRRRDVYCVVMGLV
jgi:hypothetical protein